MFKNLHRALKAYAHRLVFLGYNRHSHNAKLSRNASRNINSSELLAKLESLLRTIHSASKDRHHNKDRQETLRKHLGFTLFPRPSNIPTAGTGIFLHGHAPPNTIVSLYPGTIYSPGDPAFFISLKNSYLLRCYDGYLLDGKPTGLSSKIYNSIYARHHADPELSKLADNTWMTTCSNNPLAVGQMINNGTRKFPANVYYQELNIPPSFPGELRKYIPNLHYENGWRPWDEDFTRVVLLVTRRDVLDKELFSTYHEVVG